MSISSKRIITQGVLNAETLRTGVDPNARRLTFHANNLGQHTYLMLAFDPPKSTTPEALGQEEFALCWKVIHFAASGIQSVTIDYTAKTAFFVPEVTEGNLVNSTNAQLCNTGEQCSVITEEGMNVVSEPEKGEEDKEIVCCNKTANRTAIGIGFYSEKKEAVEPAFIWQNVPVDGKVRVELIPNLNLKIYQTHSYQETKVIKGHITGDFLWSHSLMSLDNASEYNVDIDPGTDKLVVEAKDT